MSELSGAISEQVEHAVESRLNSQIAVIVSICACLMAVFNIKDNNITQAMAQAQANMIDSWSYYQAKSVKQGMIETNKNQLEIQLELNEKSNQKVINKISSLIENYQNKIKKYEQEKEEIKQQAEGFKTEYDTLNFYDDQFDLAEALISLSLSLLGISALIQKRSMFYFALTFAGVGVFFGVAGFMHLPVHPDAVMKFLS